MLSTLLKNENAKCMNEAIGNGVLKQRMLLKMPDLNTGSPHTSRQTIGEIKNSNRGLPFPKEVKEYQIAT